MRQSLELPKMILSFSISNTLALTSEIKISLSKETLMNRIIAFPILVIFGLPAPAQADFSSFETAIIEICLPALPDMKPAIAEFDSRGWQGFAGADEGEFEYYKNGTAVFIISSNAYETGMQPGCTVIDENVSLFEAKLSLELALDKYFEGRWQTGNNQWGPVWRLLLETGTVVFTVQEDPSRNGAAVSFELRQ